MARFRTAALVGNPNAGKSALFNALTGARQKIANYAGVTVERKAGRLVLPSGEPVELTEEEMLELYGAGRNSFRPGVEALETREWLESLDDVLRHGGSARVGRLLRELGIHAQQSGVRLPFTANTPYINTIPVEQQSPIPGDQDIEHKIRSYVRWNAMAMVLRANKDTNVGGHIGSFQSL